MDEIICIAILSLMARLLEDGRKIGLSRTSGRRLKNVHGIYEALNVHCVVSVAIFALFVNNKTESVLIFCVFLIVIAGVVAKGVFSAHKPERLAWADQDTKWGLIIPNGFAIASLVVSGYVLVFRMPYAHIFNGLHSLEAFALLSVSSVVGILASGALTALGVYLLSRGMDDLEKLRVHAAGSLDILLAQASNGRLSKAQQVQLRSSMMNYAMNATSRRSAEKYLNKMRALGEDYSELLRETEEIIRERLGEN